MTKGAVARLKITLDDVQPVVMRRIEVPLALRLDRLHYVLQIAVGWTNSHLYAFRMRGIEFGVPEPEWDYGDEMVDARKTTLLAAIEDTGAKSFKYLYDFGDGWEHSIKIERIHPAMPGVTYPLLLSAIGQCPPEDVGGPWGYQEMLEALADPNHERHAEMRDWLGIDFDPDAAINTAAIDIDLLALAKRWAKRPRKKA
jgi:hypothetical protein